MSEFLLIAFGVLVGGTAGGLFMYINGYIDGYDAQREKRPPEYRRFRKREGGDDG